MKTSMFLLFIYMLLYVQSVFPAPADLEMVWLKDVTTSFETVKRTSIDLDLPDELTFHLIRGSNDLTLRLKRNHWIDPNADVYFVQKLQNGQPHVEKTENLGKEDLAYYLDRGNGAFMTVRCVRRSNGECDRVLNGNIRIGDTNFDIRPAESDITSRNVFDVPDLLGTAYVLRDQAKFARDTSVERNTDAVNVDMRKIEEAYINLPGRFAPEEHKQDNFPLKSHILASKNVKRFHNSGIIDKRNNGKYWIEITVLTDSSIWDLFLSLPKLHEGPTNVVHDNDTLAAKRIREYYSHIINGVHLSYSEIDDTSLDISVTLREFHIFKNAEELELRDHDVVRKDGKTYIDAVKYLQDIARWDKLLGKDPHYDHTMLFTRHNLFHNTMEDTSINGLADPFGICDPGGRVSLIQADSYFKTVRTAAHELGHSIGADHDGEDLAIDCPANDSFIMSEFVPRFKRGQPYPKNPLMFSSCSVMTFKMALKLRDCVKNPGIYFDKEQWTLYTNKLPGETYNPDQQCMFIKGPKSSFCGDISETICLHMTCMDPKTRTCSPMSFSAHRGTRCGTMHMWCINGKCVPKSSK